MFFFISKASFAHYEFNEKEFSNKHFYIICFEGDQVDFSICYKFSKEAVYRFDDSLQVFIKLEGIDATYYHSFLYVLNAIQTNSMYKEKIYSPGFTRSSQSWLTIQEFCDNEVVSNYKLFSHYDNYVILYTKEYLYHINRISSLKRLNK